MLDWLRSAKMARRGVEPEPDLIGELFRAASPKFKCPGCGAVGLAIRAIEEENDEAWQMARACQACGRPIARERLEAVPDAELCVACQAAADRRPAQGPLEYCPRCGNLMTLRLSRSTGLARYVVACPKCRG
jgi:predicted RNA-binding Zn-ribbon protein involved in translation (DUF1610 family)